LAASQVAAIRLALVSKVLVITGGPGVGKTTIVKGILRILAAKGVSLLLCAPAGRAAKRIVAATLEAAGFRVDYHAANGGRPEPTRPSWQPGSVEYSQEQADK
jgi:ATP-dependent exoDNAse (exonuclease V) alpha subunit